MISVTPFTFQNFALTSSCALRMFHMSSMKMGLDQAVLQGIENTGTDKDVMTKEEVEKLLKVGLRSRIV